MAKVNGTMTTLYYLLFAEYASDPIKSDYPWQWKMKVFSTVFMYAPTWAKRLEIQDAVRDLTEGDIAKGSAAIYNIAANPDGSPTTETWDTLPGINSQNVTLHKRGKLEGYAMLEALLKTDVTREFIDRFRKLFIQVVAPSSPLLYDTSNLYPEGTDAAGIVYGDTTTQMFGTYNTNTFEEMFPTAQDFINEYNESGLPKVLADA